jgi:hypothetical protein
MIDVATNFVQIVRQCSDFNTRIWCSVHVQGKFIPYRVIDVEKQKGKITNCEHFLSRK